MSEEAEEAWQPKDFHKMGDDNQEIFIKEAGHYATEIKMPEGTGIKMYWVLLPAVGDELCVCCDLQKSYADAHGEPKPIKKKKKEKGKGCLKVGDSAFYIFDSTQPVLGPFCVTCQDQLCMWEDRKNKLEDFFKKCKKTRKHWDKDEDGEDTTPQDKLEMIKDTFETFGNLNDKWKGKKAKPKFLKHFKKSVKSYMKKSVQELEDDFKDDLEHFEAFKEHLSKSFEAFAKYLDGIGEWNNGQDLPEDLDDLDLEDMEGPEDLPKAGNDHNADKAHEADKAHTTDEAHKADKAPNMGMAHKATKAHPDDLDLKDMEGRGSEDNEPVLNVEVSESPTQAKTACSSCWTPWSPGACDNPLFKHVTALE